MAEAVAAPTAASAPGARAARLVGDQLAYALRDVARTPVMAGVVLGFPLVFLLMLGVAGGDVPPDPVTGAAAIQASAPIAAVFAAVMAAYVMLPFGISQARERGVLKRLRGAPLPTWAYLAGRLGAAVAVAVAGTAAMLVVAATAFGLEVAWRAAPAALAVFLLGVLCFAALGFAAAMLLRSSASVMTFTMGSFLVVAFASGSFAPGADLPRALDVGTWLLPVRHFAEGFGAAFAPGAGAAPAWGHLAALAGWGAVGALLGAWRWSWDPPARRAAGTGRSGAPRVAVGGGAWGLWAAQVRHADRQVWRDPGSAFFVVAFPVLFTVVVPYAFGRPVIDGVALAALVAPAMAVFAVVVAAFVNMPEAVATQRERGVLKRLRGTPLPAWAYVAGRVASVVWIAGVSAAAVLLAGWAVHGVAVPAASWAPLAGALLVGALAMAALGLAVVALVPSAKAVPAVTLGLFIPLAFVSDMLAFGMELPEALAGLGWALPLKHIVYAVEAAAAGGAAWGHLAAVAGWGAVGAALAVWRFRWEPR